ncbi:MAG: VWA domain-containing protein [Enhygromyxa sp.]
MQRSHWITLASFSGVMLLAHGCSDDGNAGDAATTYIPDTGSDPTGNGDGDGDHSETGGNEEDGCPPITGCLDFPPDDDPVGCDSEGNCNLIDLLFVIDNSGTMGEEQLNLARNFPLLVQQLEALEDDSGATLGANVNIMVTTSDFGNPLCKPFAKHDPEMGAPVASACTKRLDRFTGLELFNPPSFPEACTEVCAAPGIEPLDGDLIIHFEGGGIDNVPGVPPVDINGDGIDDSPVAQALACIGPQGIDGCGYEAQLESMMQALNPIAPWNCGAPDDPQQCPDGGVERPFLREGAVLAIAIISDEADCSVKDYSIMTNKDYFATLDGEKLPSSAICWKAGVTCNGPDANGVYVNCFADDSDDVMHPVARYTDFLVKYMREGLGKEVVMLGILGVPPVTAHNPNPPHEPIEGGVHSLVYRKWRDVDILEEDMLAGIDADYQQWAFGIGPGCTGYDAMGNVTGQAIPPVRIKQVCESLNYDDRVRCCIESVCDEDFSAALGCLTDVIQDVFVPVE